MKGWYIRNQNGRKRLLNLFDNFLEMAPAVILVALIGFSSVCSLLLVLGVLRTELVWFIGLSVAILINIPVVKYYRAKKTGDREKHGTVERVLITTGVLGGILVWGFLNAPFTAEHVLINRDPALYANGAIALLDNDSLHFSSMKDIFDEETYRHTAGFGESKYNPDELHLQGLHLLPALHALIGRIVGVDAMLNFSFIFGMTALLAVYFLARQFVRPVWSLVATSIMAVSMPLIHFSRDTYTEPLALTFAATALGLLFLAYKSSNKWMWLVAGLAIGAGTLVRIDAYITIAAVIGAASIYVVTGDQKRQSQRLKHAGMLMIGMATIALIGFADVSLLSSAYFYDLRKQFSWQMLAILSASTFSTLLLVMKTHLRNKLGAISKTSLYQSLTILFLAIITILVSRPLWLVELKDGQRRTYAEYSVHWLEWYMGATLLIMGLTGVVILIYKIINKGQYVWLIPIFVILVNSLGYLTEPSISPDHIWASRRYVSIIIPSLVILGIFTISQLYTYINSKTNQDRRYNNILFFFVAIYLTTTPLTVSLPELQSVHRRELGMMKTFCDRLPQNAAVVWVGRGAITAPSSTMLLCGTPSAGLSNQGGALFPEVIARESNNLQAKGYTPVVAMFGDKINLAQTNGINPIAETSYNELELTYRHAPTQVKNSHPILFAGTMNNDGSISKL